MQLAHARTSASALATLSIASSAALVACGQLLGSLHPVLPACAALTVLAGLLSRCSGDQQRRLAAFVLVLALQLGLTIAIARVLRLLALVDLDAGEGLLSSTLALSLLAATAVLAGLWTLLRRHGLEPSFGAKLGLGHVLLGLGCTCLATALEWAPTSTSTSADTGAGAATAVLVCLAVALACAAPTCGRALHAWVPEHLRPAGFALLVASQLCAWTIGVHSDLSIPSPALAFELCLRLGLAALATAVLSSLVWRPLSEIAVGERPSSTPPAPMHPQPTASLSHG